MGKRIIWAHNGHIAKTNMLPQIYPKFAGQHLAEYYGEHYVSIGTSLYEGQFNALNSNNEVVANQIQADDLSSFNYTLGEVNADQYFVDVRKASGVTKEWLNEHRPFAIGFASADPSKPSYVDTSLSQAFDILIHIQKVTASQLNS
ncbi:erythromycin esterase family protein [Paenibacillus sp. MER TA 81-3]|nr:erythromycin esterase family protein [Paenibacillus sp. MER TA 81-3]